MHHVITKKCGGATLPPPCLRGVITKKKLLQKVHFLVVFSFFEIPIVVRNVCPSVEIISFRGDLISNRPIDLKIVLNVR